MYLLDTVTISDLKKRRRNPGAAAWLSAQRPGDLFVSVLTLGEIQAGIASKAIKDPRAAGALAQWLDETVTFYAGRILDFDLQAARRWGVLSAQVGNDSIDLMIAATALEHGLIVVTRNLRHFEPTGVATLDPFSAVT